MATWYFCFSDTPSGEYKGNKYDRLVVECPWRMTKSGTIVTGSEDHSIEVDDKEFESWSPGYPGGFQHQKLEELLGKRIGTEVYNTGSMFIVKSVAADKCGGLRVTLTGGYLFEVFPASNLQMEWAFKSRGSGLVLMNGKLNVTKGQRKNGEIH